MKTCAEVIKKNFLKKKKKKKKQEENKNPQSLCLTVNLSYMSFPFGVTFPNVLNIISSNLLYAHICKFFLDNNQVHLERNFLVLHSGVRLF